MSTEYWTISGIGLSVDDLDFEKLNVAKCARALANWLSTSEVSYTKVLGFELAKILEEDKAASDLTIETLEDYVDLYSLDFARFLASLDETETLCWGSSGDFDDESSNYLFFPPLYPWQIGPNTPMTIDQVHAIIVSTIQKVFDLSVGQ